MPTQVSVINGIIAISGGGTHSLFLKNDGTVWGCGFNGFGALCDGTNIQRLNPIQINSLTGITAISGGEDHSLFLKNDGNVWACGDNYFGQLGDGTVTKKYLPVQVTGLCKVPIGIKENIMKNNTIIFPNPSIGIFDIKSKNLISKIEITDLLGKTIYSEKINAMQTKIDLSNHEKGIYFCVLFCNNETIIVKISVE